MAFPMKKTLELARQKFNVSLKDEDGEFIPTSNDRNNAMLKESYKFAQALKVVHKDLTDVARVVGSGLETVRKVLDMTLPRVYEDGPGGAFPDVKDLTLVGDGVHSDALAASTADTQQRLTNEVLIPISQWLEAYKIIKERNARLEEVRIQLDIKRRAFATYKSKYLKSVAKVKSLNEQEAVYYRAQTEEDKMNRLVSRYLEMEEEVFGALHELVKDSHCLRDYMFASMLILKRTFGGAVWAFTDAYPGLEVVDVPEAVTNAPRANRDNLNTRFGYLSPTALGSIASHRNTQQNQPALTAPSGAEDDIPTATISNSTARKGY